MKKIIIFILVVCVVNGCLSKNDVETNNENIDDAITDVNKDNVDDSTIDEENDNDGIAIVDKELDENLNTNFLLGQIFELILPYLESHSMKYYDFKERQELINFLTYDVYQEALKNCFYVEKLQSDGFTKPNYFHKTIDESIYLYYGDFDENNCPTGRGILFQNVSDYEGSSTLVLRYVGNFSNGLYEGYGIEFDQTMYDKNYNSTTYNKDYYTKNFLIVNAGYLHESYYKEGKGINQSNTYSMNLFESLIYAKDPDNIVVNDLKYNLKSMKYLSEDGIWECNSYWYGCPQFIGYLDENGKKTGNCKTYYSYSANLAYEGDYLYDEEHGNGKKYLENGNLVYEGEFQNGKYHGKGVLYDEDGRVLHKGEFSYGDVK